MPPLKVEEDDLIERFSMPYRIPEFAQEHDTIAAYQQTLMLVRTILTDRMKRIEKLLERKVLTDSIDGDCRSARGKILILLQKNMTRFQKLLDDSSADDKQTIDDLSGFWSLITQELKDVQKACEAVEKHRLNKWKP